MDESVVELWLIKHSIDYDYIFCYDLENVDIVQGVKLLYSGLWQDLMTLYY